MPPAPAGPPDLRVTPVGIEGQVAFRVLPTADRRASDFLDAFRSSLERGIPPRPQSPEERFQIIRAGISCFSTSRQAENKAKRLGLGDYVAELHLPPGQGVCLARWGGRGHMTVWGEAVKLASAVVDIVRIEH